MADVAIPSGHAHQVQEPEFLHPVSQEWRITPYVRAYRSHPLPGFWPYEVAIWWLSVNLQQPQTAIS
jgi:hypothetical protein